MWNLGELKLEVHVSLGGEIKLKIESLSDELFKMFPIDDTRRLFLSDEDFNEYVQDVLDKREKWIRDNVPAGVYSLVIKLDEEYLEKEAVK